MDRFRAAVVVLWVLAALGLPIESFAGAEGPSPSRCFDATQSTVEQVSFTGTCPDESLFAGLVRSSGFTYFCLEDTIDLTWSPPGVTSTPVAGIVGGHANIFA